MSRVRCPWMDAKADVQDVALYSFWNEVVLTNKLEEIPSIRGLAEDPPEMTILVLTKSFRRNKRLIITKYRLNRQLF